MVRAKKHYLNRYATATDFGISQVTLLAKILTSDSCSTTEKVSAAIEFSELVTTEENHHWADYESRTVQRLYLVNALTYVLKELGSTSPRYTAEMTLKIGVEMHLNPVSFDLESIAKQICKQYPSLTYEHLLKMARHLVIEADDAADVQLNQERCLQLAQLAADGDWSPKMLESEIKKSLGLRSGGRPRKAR